MMWTLISECNFTSPSLFECHFFFSSASPWLSLTTLYAFKFGTKYEKIEVFYLTMSLESNTNLCIINRVCILFHS